jgi:hypothetical protein
MPARPGALAEALEREPITLVRTPIDHPGRAE